MCLSARLDTGCLQGTFLVDSMRIACNVVSRPRPTTDTRIAVDIRELFRHIGGNVGGKALYRWNSDRVGQVPVATAFTLTSPELITVTNLGGLMPDETLDVTYTLCRYGGRRAWFLCTKLGCGKRVAILYDHPRGFRCRHCCQLDYKSHRERAYDRMLRRSRRLRAKVGGGVNLIEAFPARPKGMHWATYDQLLRSEAALWGEIDSAAADRLCGRDLTRHQ
jgi:hypothetical protein